LAVAARAAEQHIVTPDGVAAPARDTLERSLEGGVLERLDLPTVVADEVVVMLTIGVSRLEARDAVAEVDPLHEPELVEALERAVDARDADARRPGAELVVDLLRGDAAVLPTEELDDRSAGAAASTGRGM
jgi:hypothetical protein